MKKIIYGFLVFILCTYRADTQNETYHPIEKDKWEKAVDGLDYNETIEEEIQDDQEREPREMPEVRKPFSLSLDWLKILIFAAIAALLIFILLKLFGKGASNPAVKPVSATINDLEDKPMESDLERFLRQAIETGNFKLAVRIYYLMVLKGLQDKGLIVWKKNKTNFDYLIEVAQHPQFQQLNQSTLIYEYIWYGDRQIAEPQFKSISISFLRLIEKIGSEK